jgi:hypothetical protein
MKNTVDKNAIGHKLGEIASRWFWRIGDCFFINKCFIDKQ